MRALLAAVLLAGCLSPPAAPLPDVVEDVTRPAAVVETDAGAFTMILYEAEAPRTVANFRALAGNGFYDGVVFHRVIDGFVIQTGDPTGTGSGGSLETVPGEPGVHLAAGTVGMARDEDPDSATSQWFVDEYPQPHLHDPPEGSTYGAFTAWAQVVEGMEVVKAIAAAETFAKAAPDTPVPIPPGTLPDRPTEDIRIRSVAFVDLPMPADAATRYPLKTTGRYVTDDLRVVVETWNAVPAAGATELVWYTVPRRADVQPLDRAEVLARGPTGNATFALARDAEDPFVLRMPVTFPEPGTWNLTLVAGGATHAMFDVQVG